MHFMDPFPTRCEFCQHKAYYPLKPLKAEKAGCLSCGKVLRKAARNIRRTEREHGIEIWPMALVFELMLQADVDLDLISEEEYDSASTLSAVIALLQLGETPMTTQEVLDFEMLSHLRTRLSDEQLLTLELKELAQWEHPEQPNPDDSLPADPDVKGIETADFQAAFRAKHQKSKAKREALLKSRPSMAEWPSPENTADAAFWRRDDSRFPLSAAAILPIEDALGYTLPTRYRQLMQLQNGGCAKNTLIRLYDSEAQAPERQGAGVAGKKHCETRVDTFFRLDSLAEDHQHSVDEWGYPDIGLYIARCPSAGHQMIALDYRHNGPAGEPSVVLVDQTDDYSITPLADNFEQFVSRLEPDSDE